MNETFTDADLEPSDDEKAAKRRIVVDRAAATVAVLSIGVVVGGMLALGAAAAPMVFHLTPAPFSGRAMGAAFARFDRIAIGASVALMAAEVVRTWIARRGRPKLLQRIRRLSGFGVAACAAVMGLSLTPTINELYLGGARRGEGEAGERLETIHRRAERLGQIEALLGIVAIGLHVFTVRSRDDEDEEIEHRAPAPPGPACG